MTEYVRCDRCNKVVADNWLTRHKASGCNVGGRDKFPGPRGKRVYTWGVRPENGQKIFAFNRLNKQWEEVTYLMDDNGTLCADNGWRKPLKRCRNMYTKWCE